MIQEKLTCIGWEEPLLRGNGEEGSFQSRACSRLLVVGKCRAAQWLT